MIKSYGIPKYSTAYRKKWDEKKMVSDRLVSGPGGSALCAPTGADSALALWLKCCPACQGLAFPPTLPACAACGHSLEGVPSVPAEGPYFLREFVTIHVPLVDGVKPPMTVGDIEIAPGVIRQAVVAVASEAELFHGQAMRPVWSVSSEGTPPLCVFVPAVGVKP